MPTCEQRVSFADEVATYHSSQVEETTSNFETLTEHELNFEAGLLISSTSSGVEGFLQPYANALWPACNKIVSQLEFDWLVFHSLDVTEPPISLPVDVYKLISVYSNALLPPSTTTLKCRYHLVLTLLPK